MPPNNDPQLALPAAAAPTRTNFKYDYTLALFRAFLFFEIQRGGEQAADSRTWRKDDASQLDAAAVGTASASLDGGWWEAGSAHFLLSPNCV